MSRIDSQVSAVQFRLTLSVLVEWLSVAAFALATGTLAVIIIERLLPASRAGFVNPDTS